jgi:hypothetical protein
MRFPVIRKPDPSTCIEADILIIIYQETERVKFE